jgi:hypothetical protein
MSLVVRLAVLLAAAAVVVVEARPPSRPFRQLEGPLLPSPGLVRALMPGFPDLSADLYWIQLTNQVGEANTAEEYRRAYDYAELITELAPLFVEVYQFAGAVIPFNRGRDTWVNTDESLKIVRKGLALFPEDPILLGYLAFDLMFLERDYKAAADVFKHLASRPNAPPHYAQLATRLYAQSGDFDQGEELAKMMAESAGSEEQKGFFEHRVRQIESEKLLTAVDQAAWAFYRREGRQPTTVAELLASGDLTSPPIDPLGGEIVIDDFGRARTTAENFRLEVYEDVSKTLAKPDEKQP